MTADPTQPDVTEIEQSEVHIPSVPVTVEGPVRVQRLPGVTTVFGNRESITSTEAVKILEEDPRRLIAFVIGNDQSIVVGATQQQAMVNGAQWPANVPMQIDGKDEVWVRASSTSVRVSWIVSHWTE
jgi:hypothetical protein